MSNRTEALRIIDDAERDVLFNRYKQALESISGCIDVDYAIKRAQIALGELPDSALDGYMSETARAIWTKEKTPMSNRNKIIAAIIVAVLLLGGYLYLNNLNW